VSGRIDILMMAHVVVPKEHLTIKQEKSRRDDRIFQPSRWDSPASNSIPALKRRAIVRSPGWDIKKSKTSGEAKHFFDSFSADFFQNAVHRFLAECLIATTNEHKGFSLSDKARHLCFWSGCRFQGIMMTA